MLCIRRENIYFYKFAEVDCHWIQVYHYSSLGSTTLRSLVCSQKNFVLKMSLIPAKRAQISIRVFFFASQYWLIHMWDIIRDGTELCTFMGIDQFNSVLSSIDSHESNRCQISVPENASGAAREQVHKRDNKAGCPPN